MCILDLKRDKLQVRRVVLVEPPPSKCEFFSCTPDELHNFLETSGNSDLTWVVWLAVLNAFRVVGENTLRFTQKWSLESVPLRAALFALFAKRVKAASMLIPRDAAQGHNHSDG